MDLCLALRAAQALETRRIKSAYHRSSGEIVAFVWGKRNLKTAKMLRTKLATLGVSFDTVFSDSWESFKGAFAADNHIIGKENTVGIEGNNCRLRHIANSLYFVM